MATQSLRLISMSDGSVWADLIYDDATMTATGVTWSNPRRVASVTVWDPTGTLLFSGAPKDQGSTNLRRNQQFTINLTPGQEVLPRYSFGFSN